MVVWLVVYVFDFLKIVEFGLVEVMVVDYNSCELVFYCLRKICFCSF